MTRIGVGIIGLGKIATDQHVPVLAKSTGLVLAGIASRSGQRVEGVPTFATPEAMYAALPDLTAVAVCTPPQVRHATARAALAAGRHVLLEKPPAATLGELAALEAFAAEQGRVLFTTWHSQFNPAVDRARAELEGERIARLRLEWKEDVRRWHPGQRWIWNAGGFGVFDPGINAFSILTKILPEPLFVTAADLLFPANCAAPIAADLTFATPSRSEGLTGALDWLQEGEQSWNIDIATESGRELKLRQGGRRLEIDGSLVTEAPSLEYEAIYERFAELLASGRSDVEPAPLRLVADAFLVGRRLETDPFVE